MSADDLYSVGEDHIIYKYNVIQNELVKIAELAQDIYPLDMHWVPKGASAGGGGGQGSSSTYRWKTYDWFRSFCFSNK